MRAKRTRGFRPNQRIRAALLLGACALTASCTQKIGPAPSLAPVDTPFSHSGTAELQDEWWEAFDDPALDRLIHTALDSSPDLAGVWERLQASEALARRERSGLFPRLNSSLGLSSEREGGNSTELFSAGLSAGYEVDLWGRIRSAAEAERLRAEASRADYETAALTLSGEVALAWYRLLARKEALAVIEEQISANEKVVESLLTRFRGGEARSVDVLRQERLLESTRELKLVAESEISVLKNQLQVLLGRAPQEPFQADSSKLPELSPLPETGLPADLLLRRPDLQSAYLQLLAADRDLASAISERYPRIDLTANLRTSAEDSSEIFDDWLRRIAGEVVAPLIDGGRRRAEVARQEAVKRQRLEEFTQASLLAFQDVENALVRGAKEAERLDSLEKQMNLQELAFEQLQKQFLNGVGSFIDVLTAQTGAQQLQRDLVESKRRQIEFRIALHRALAGPVEPQKSQQL